MDIYKKGTVPEKLKTLSPRKVLELMEPHLLRHGIVLLPDKARFTAEYMFHVPVELFLGEDLSQKPEKAASIRAAFYGESCNLLFTVNGKGHITYLNQGGKSVGQERAVEETFYEVFGPPTDPT